MLISCVWDFVYDDGGTVPLLLIGTFLTCFGIFFYVLCIRFWQVRLREVYILLTTAIITSVVFCSLPFQLYGRHLVGVDAWFEVLSAITLNGLSVLQNPDILPHSLQFWRLLLQWLGGLGVLTLGIAILPQLGGTGFQLLKVEATSGTEDLASLRARHDVGWAFLTLTILTASGIILFALQGLPVFDAIGLTISTITSGGLHLHPEGIAIYQGVLFKETLIVYMLLSAISSGLLLQALKGDFVAPFRSSIFRYFVGYIIFFHILFFLALPVQWSEMNWSSILSYSIQLVSAITTNGIHSLEPLEKYSNLILLYFIIAMWIGGMAGAMSGGIKFHRIVLLMKQIRATFHRSVHPNVVLKVEMDGRFITSSTISDVLSFLSVATFFTILLIVVLVWSGLDWITSISASVAALSGGGLAFGGLSESGSCVNLPLHVKVLLMMGMALGRVEFFAFIALFSRTFWRS
ncbi:MAG: hypothetical protein N2450_01410 [bacterium]|nr:hypothetical protein [bacterium]